MTFGSMAIWTAPATAGPAPDFDPDPLYGTCHSLRDGVWIRIAWNGEGDAETELFDASLTGSLRNSLVLTLSMPRPQTYFGVNFVFYTDRSSCENSNNAARTNTPRICFAFSATAWSPTMGDDSEWSDGYFDVGPPPELQLNTTYKSSAYPSEFYGFYWGEEGWDDSDPPTPATFTVTFQNLNDDDTCGPKLEFGPICPIDTPANTLLPDCPIGANRTGGTEDGALPNTL
jgi:hypothetical protein